MNTNMSTSSPGSTLASENKRKNKSNQRERHRKRDSEENRVTARNNETQRRGKLVVGKVDDLRCRNLGKKLNSKTLFGFG